jgi:transposase-like protein
MTKHYSKEFRLQAARLVTEQGYSYAEVAQRLGPTSWSVRNWVRQFRQSGENTHRQRQIFPCPNLPEAVL